MRHNFFFFAKSCTMNANMPFPNLYPVNHVPSLRHYPIAYHLGNREIFDFLYKYRQFVSDQLLVLVLNEHIVLIIRKKKPSINKSTIGMEHIELLYKITYLLHLLQFSTNIFPCSSAKCCRDKPDFKCKPSIF